MPHWWIWFVHKNEGIWISWHDSMLRYNQWHFHLWRWLMLYTHYRGNMCAICYAQPCALGHIQELFLRRRWFCWLRSIRGWLFRLFFSIFQVTCDDFVYTLTIGRTCVLFVTLNLVLWVISKSFFLRREMILLVEVNRRLAVQALLLHLPSDMWCKNDSFPSVILINEISIIFSMRLFCEYPWKECVTV